MKANKRQLLLSRVRGLRGESHGKVTVKHSMASARNGEGEGCFGSTGKEIVASATKEGTFEQNLHG